MSSTAYQRAAVDLKRAGLNRILAIGSPSSTPGGAQARFENAGKQLGESVDKGVSQALVAKRLSAEIKNIDARTELTDAQRRALGPAAEGGDIVTDAATSAKEGANRFIEEIKLGPPKARTKMTPSIQKRAIRQIAKSVGLNPEKAERLLLKTLRQMDLPDTWSDQQRLDWALRHPDRVKAYIARQR